MPEKTPCPHPADQRVTGPDGLDFCPACESEARLPPSLPKCTAARISTGYDTPEDRACVLPAPHIGRRHRDRQGIEFGPLNFGVTSPPGPAEFVLPAAELQAARDLLDRLGAPNVFKGHTPSQNRDLTLAARIEALVETHTQRGLALHDILDDAGVPNIDVEGTGSALDLKLEQRVRWLVARLADDDEGDGMTPEIAAGRVGGWRDRDMRAAWDNGFDLGSGIGHASKVQLDEDFTRFISNHGRAIADRYLATIKGA